MWSTHSGTCHGRGPAGFSIYFIPSITNYQALDAGVGRVVAALKKSGLYKNSVLIFSSDNGGNFPGASNYPLRGLKGELYEGGIKAVQFVHSPLLKRSYTHNK